MNGKMVATVRGATSVATLQEVGAKVIEVTHIEDAYRLLGKNAVKYKRLYLMHQMSCIT